MLFSLQRLVILRNVGDAGVLRDGGDKGLQGGLWGFLIDLHTIFLSKGLDDGVRVAIALLRRLILLCALAKQVVAVPEQAVVGPVGGGCSNGHHGDPVNREHHQRKNRQAQPAVGDDFVDLVGGA